MEGAYPRIPSVAVSLQWGEKRHYDSKQPKFYTVLTVFPKAHLAAKSLLDGERPQCAIR